jgi:hypothetical protein
MFMNDLFMMGFVHLPWLQGAYGSSIAAESSDVSRHRFAYNS